MNLSIYKKQLKELKISHQNVGDYTGHTREAVSLWLGGKRLPEKARIHISGEIEEMIERKKQALKEEIHFVCTGNTFRSRLAEAYTNSKQIPSVRATSSGISADKNISGPISWYTQKIIMNHNITPFESFSWQKTTKELINNAEIVVFFEEKHYQFAYENLGFKGEKYFIWDIPDLDPQRVGETARIKDSERIYDLIKEQVDKLIQFITSN